MPTATLPSEADLQAVWTACVAVLENIRKHGNVDTPNFVDKANYALTLTASDHQREVTAAMDAARARLAGIVSIEQGAAILRPLLRTYARVLGVPDVDDAAIWQEIYDHFIANSKRVTTRNIGFGSVSAGGSNIGDGTIHRVTVDAEGYEIEAVHTETKVARCVADEHSGATEHEEVFELRGEAAAKDLLELDGSGLRVRVAAMSGRSTSAFLDNPSFSSLGGGTDAVPTSILGWDVDTIANVELGRNTGEFYRDFQGDTSPAGLKLKGDVVVSQNLNERGVRVDPAFPYYLQVAWNRGSSCDGTLTLRLGASSTSVAVNTGTNGTWNILKIPLGTANWFENWNEEDPTVSIELAGRTIGHVWVDDVVFGPMYRCDRTYVAVVGGDTPFLRDDLFTWTDTDGGTGILQRWSWRIFGEYLPYSTGGTVTWADPS